ncbi:hypothetical protein HGRIS_009064 [Hohenbuehelia grisea]|uniref:DUF654-domain-containing protein n=1 Tax=Hohenbuehelia grisea TaxID=104357 RepID=A0ABR3J005_9AGAR
MPPRLNKRQQRELEELEALRLAATDDGPVVSDEDEDEEQGRATGSSGFAALMQTQGGQESDEDDDESSQQVTKKAKKKKKKKSETKPPPTIEESAAKPPVKPAAPVTALPKHERKAAKKARAKEKKVERDELDQVLSELSEKYPELQNIGTNPGESSSTSSQQTLASLLAVSIPHLDAEAEMRKFFGSKVVQANKASSSGPQGQGSRRHVSAALKSNLTQPKPTWWAAKLREGLSTRPLSDAEYDEREKRHSAACGRTKRELCLGEKIWTVEYSKKYKSMTMAFMGTVLSGDPEGFWNLLGRLPWHADTLLQLSEVYRHREEYAQAVDFVDRALFAYERSFIGAFSFTSGLNRLDFDHVENRPFYLALHRQITDLQRRGCVRTAFEFARLMYSMDPWDDPHGALLHLDFLGMKAGMAQWLLDVYDHFSSSVTVIGRPNHSRFDPTCLPSWNYTRALALRSIEDSKKDKDHVASTSALIQAVRSFPSVVPLLADKLDVQLPGEIRGHRSFRIETDATSLSDELGVLHLLSHLYVQRSFALWKNSDISSWFASTVKDEFSSLPSGDLPHTDLSVRFNGYFSNIQLRYSIYRHVMVLESSYRRLFSFIPRHVLSAKSLACDPLPPLTAATEYNDDFFRGADDVFSMRNRTRQERAADDRRLERLIPDPLMRQQLQVVFDVQPDLVQRFPGGFLQFAQAVAQLPEDVLDDFLLAGFAGVQDGGVMPGQMPDMPNPLDEEFADQPRGAGELDAEFDLFPPDDIGNGENDDELNEEGEEEEDDSDEDIAPMPVRVIRNLLGRFWGGNVPAQDAESSDEEVENVQQRFIDEDGVD